MDDRTLISSSILFLTFIYLQLLKEFLPLIANMERSLQQHFNNKQDGPLNVRVTKKTHPPFPLVFLQLSSFIMFRQREAYELKSTECHWSKSQSGMQKLKAHNRRLPIVSNILINKQIHRICKFMYRNDKSYISFHKVQEKMHQHNMTTRYNFNNNTK